MQAIAGSREANSMFQMLARGAGRKRVLLMLNDTNIQEEGGKEYDTEFFTTSMKLQSVGAICLCMACADTCICAGSRQMTVNTMEAII